MDQTARIVVVSQHYPPDQSTTAAIMAVIAGHLVAQAPVLVISGTPGSASYETTGPDRPVVVEVKNRIPAKAALIRRGAAEALFSMRVFVALLVKLRRGDVALTVPAPFMLPYAVAAAARLKRARSALIMHDLYPDVLVMAGLLKPASILAKAIRAANVLMFHALDAVVIIGRDTERLLLRYGGITRDKIRFIPNWASLTPAVRPIRPDNRYRLAHADRFLVGLSGNLGFTHDHDVVFDAAILLQNDPSIHFLLSGWGMGFERLKARQADAALTNVTLVDRVPGKAKKLQTYTADQVRTVLRGIAEDRNRHAWHLALAGLRRGEIAGQRWADIDLENRTLRIGTTRVDVGGRAVDQDEPKTANAGRALPIPEALLAELVAAKARQAAEKLALGEAYADQGFVGAMRPANRITRRR